MHIKEITVKAGRTFNHPHESYSNLRADVEFRAELDASDSSTDEGIQTATRRLQKQAETLVEAHKENILKQIELLAARRDKLNQIDRLKQRVKSDSELLTALQKDIPQMPMVVIDTFEPRDEENR